MQTYKNANYHYLFYKDTYKLRTYIKYFRAPAFGGEVSEAGIKKTKKDYRRNVRALWWQECGPWTTPFLKEKYIISAIEEFIS